MLKSDNFQSFSFFANDKEQYSYLLRFVICMTESTCYSEFSYKLNTQKSNRQAHCSIRAISYRCKFGKLSMFKRKWETLTSSKITSSKTTSSKITLSKITSSKITLSKITLSKSKKMIEKQVVDHFVKKDEVWVRGYVCWRFRGIVLGV
jgi:hypothetical protein